MDKSKVIDYKGSRFVVGLDWKEFSASKPKIIKNKIKTTVARNKYDGFGVKISTDKTKEQVGFSNKKNKGISSFAKVFANNSDFYGSLVICKISNQEYWTVSITEDGFIVTGQDSFYNEDDFVETVGDFLQIEGDKINVFVVEDYFDEVEELLVDYIEDTELQSFDVDVAIANGIKSTEVEQVYNASADNLKQLGMLGATAALAAVGYFYIYQENSTYHEIVNEEYSQAFKSDYAKFVRGIKKKNNKSDLTDTKSLILNAKKEITEIHMTTYSNEDIFNELDFLFNSFPLYLVEWELVDINYINTGSSESFRVSYKRIPNSFGFKSQFEEEINKILTAGDFGNYQISYPDVKADTSFINFSFKPNFRQAEIARLEEIAKNKANKENPKKKKNNTETLTKEEYKSKLEKVKKSIEQVEYDTMELGFFDKRFGSALEDNEAMIQNYVSQGEKIFRDIAQSEKKDKVVVVEDFDNFDYKLLGGSRSGMLSMMQKHSYYAWTESSKSVVFPKIKRGIKTDEGFKPFARMFEFGVSVGGNIDVIGMSGLRTILLNDNILNKPYIIIKEINFNLNSEVWSIKGETYEKI
tara:strand:- start:32335 stop:34083 length:1749 start_codon:yes stop_codon:yes gene_type:complete